MGLEIEIVKKFDEFGLEDVILSYSKEDVEEAIEETKKEDIKKQLKIIASNWSAAEKVLGAIKKLAESITEEDSFEDDWEGEEDDDWNSDNFDEEDY